MEMFFGVLFPQLTDLDWFAINSLIILSVVGGIGVRLVAHERWFMHDYLLGCACWFMIDVFIWGVLV